MKYLPIYLEAVRWPVNCFTWSRSMFNLILSSKFESTGKLIMHTYWTSMLWSIDSCQNWVSADQYLFYRIAGSGVDPSRSSIFEVIRWQVTSLQMMAGSSLIFLSFIWNMLCFCAAKLKFWFQTDLGRKNSASYCRQGRQLRWLNPVFLGGCHPTLKLSGILTFTFIVNLTQNG